MDEDIRSHKKYWYAISEYPGMSIITVDDDIIYSSDTIKDLVEGSKNILVVLSLDIQVKFAMI